MARRVIDIKKVQFADFWYANQWGLTDNVRPRWSVNGTRFNPRERLHDGSETLLSFAKRTGKLDRWTANVKFQFAANHAARYTGDKAKELWRAWNARIFGKPKQKAND